MLIKYNTYEVLRTFHTCLFAPHYVISSTNMLFHPHLSHYFFHNYKVISSILIKLPSVFMRSFPLHLSRCSIHTYVVIHAVFITLMSTQLSRDFIFTTLVPAILLRYFPHIIYLSHASLHACQVISSKLITLVHPLLKRTFSHYFHPYPIFSTSFITLFQRHLSSHYVHPCRVI